MFPRPTCIFVATSVVIVVGSVTAGASPLVPTAVIQNLHEISDAIQGLTATVAGHQSYRFVQEIAETLKSQQTALVQLLSKSVGTQVPQCPATNCDLTVSMGELKADLRHVSQAVGAAVDRVTSLEQDKLQRQSESVEATISRLDQFLRKVETLASRTHEVDQDKEKLQAYVGTEKANNKGSCRPPFYQVGDDCLFVQNVVKHTWENARKFCRNFGGDLVVPSDVLQLREFITLFGENSFWIGGVDLSDNNKWQWLDGSEIDRTVGWSPSQPDNLSGENCIHYWGRKDWYFNDNVCSVPMYFICQDATYAL